MRYVFFSFHYENDIWRVNQVRNNWVTKGNFASAGYVDAAEFEEVKKKGDEAIKRWIDNQLYGTSVTVVLLGDDTLSRPYVQYEIQKSIDRGNAIIGIKIDWLKNKDGEYGGTPPVYTYINGKPFNQIAQKIYCYKNDNGYENLGKWVEEATQNN